MSHISELLSGTLPDADQLGTLAVSDLRISGIKSELFNQPYTGAGLNESSVGDLLKSAWTLRNDPNRRLCARAVLLAAPMFYPVANGETFASQLVEENGKPILDVLINIPQAIEDAGSSSRQTTGSSVSRLLKAIETKETGPWGQVPSSEITRAFAVLGVYPWRTLVKSAGATEAPWFTTQGGIYVRMVTALNTTFTQAGSNSDILNDIARWYKDVDPSELTQSSHAAVMIRLLSRSALIPPYIAAAIQSVWMYHGLGTYLFLRHAASCLHITPIQLLSDVVMPLLNTTIDALCNLMIEEKKEAATRPYFPYIKILHSNFHINVSIKNAVPFMYLMRQIIEPLKPDAALPTSGIWAKICPKPGDDICEVLYTAAIRLRRKHLLAVKPNVTSDLMKSVLEDCASGMGQSRHPPRSDFEHDDDLSELGDPPLE
ncbi:TPA_asm: hypothetical protein [Metorhabdovirus 1]|nr:TPA_asm: hypothetical protein [Metorhabdovirus 1]